ncbi:HAD family phosphatase [Chryseotalea sanaruensis]|uniref:HAD family phosphatase n=1 Tax=Chryseotalea sanaruensis TaxID=2482724 RepID=A0A401UCM8_9BACT|nr:HAD family phosphatase [Chryseotalea sanaruensis]GCC52639.1 HAD family phosphatase [Chryseotalea sanaruensis]
MNAIAFLFDMDGVLIDSNPFHKIALKDFCKKYGQDLSEEQLHAKIYGRTNRDWITNVFGKLPEAQLKAYAYEKEQLFRDIYQNHVQPLNGLIGFLDQLDLYYIKRAIATSAPRANVDFTIKHTGIGLYFDTILDESFVSKGKPDPEIYLKTAAALGFDPANCVVFEDSLSGVAAGKAAGCKVVGITTTHNASELKESDIVMADFAGINALELIKKLF